MHLTNGNAAKRKRVWTTNRGAMATCRSGRRGMDLAGLPAKPVQLSSQMAIIGRLLLVVRIWQPLLWYEPGKKQSHAVVV